MARRRRRTSAARPTPKPWLPPSSARSPRRACRARRRGLVGRTLAVRLKTDARFDEKRPRRAEMRAAERITEVQGVLLIGEVEHARAKRDARACADPVNL